ncbi:MAG: hypothetical protein KBC62_04300, partial [Candidatus Pacebacteria bacterium]|nr:hypothetical protein [Candidatus Paceibacterota bacterium]
MPPLSKSSALSLLLTLSLLFPSVSLAIEGSLGGDADTSGYGGGTSDTSDTSTGAPGPEAPDYSGENNGADSPSETGPGPGVSAEEAAANDQAKADAQTAASYGMNGTVDTNATSYGRQNGTIDDDQVAMSDGTVQSLSQGKAAADAIANANNIGAPVDPTATHNMYQGNPNTPAGNVVSNGTYTKGISGPAATVAKAEIVAGNNVQASAKALASGYTSVVNGVKDIAGAVTAATNPAKSQTYQQGLAQSFYSGPKGVSVTTDNQSYVNSTLGSNTGLNTAAQNAASNAGKYSYD